MSLHGAFSESFNCGYEISTRNSPELGYISASLAAGGVF
jgi:hypothetical protein